MIGNRSRSGSSSVENRSIRMSSDCAAIGSHPQWAPQPAYPHKCHFCVGRKISTLLRNCQQKSRPAFAFGPIVVRLSPRSACAILVIATTAQTLRVIRERLGCEPVTRAFATIFVQAQTAFEEQLKKTAPQSFEE